MARLGYTPESAVERQIKDGSKYDKYFPKALGTKVLAKANGSVQDTVDLMKQMVKDYSHQTDKIAAHLAVKENGKLNIRKTAQAVWQFVFDYIKYNYEVGEQLQTPAHTWYQAQVLARQNPTKANSADCDCMAIFSACCFHSLGIPCSFRIAGYRNPLGFSNGYQHVYVVVHDNGNDILVDPVTNRFDYEKEPAIQTTFPMSLNGTDIYMLAGDGEENSAYGHVYSVQPDGSLGELGGKKKRKAKRAERKAKRKAKKQAKKDKRAAKKEIRKARKELRKARRSGDKEAIAAAKAKKEAAKQKKQEAKERIDANRTGISKFVSKAGKFIKKGALLVPRSAFLLLLRLNFRGMARKFSNNQNAYNKFARIWKNLGGKQSKLQKAIDKGKGRKALFGSKKNVGNLEGQLREIGEVFYGLGWITDRYVNDLNLMGTFGTLGEPVMAAVGTAITTAVPIVKKVMAVMQEVGEMLPETPEEAEQQGMETEYADEETPVSYEESDVDDTGGGDDYNDIYSNEPDTTEDAYAEVIEEEEEIPEMSGYPLKGFQDGVYFIDDAINTKTGETLGKGLFKKVFSKAGSVIKNIKSKRADKKAAKASGKSEKQGLFKRLKAKRATKKASKTAAKQEKKQLRVTRRQTKKDARAQRKAEKQSVRNKPIEQTENTSESSVSPTPKSKITTFFKNTKQKIKQVSQSPAAQQAQQYITAMMPAQQSSQQIQPQIKMDNIANNNPQQESALSKYKVPIIIGGVLLLAGGAYLMFGNKDNNSTSKGKTLKSIELS